MSYRRTWLAAAGLGLVAAGAGYHLWARRQAQARLAEPQRIGVAPFENQSGDPALDWAARFLSESATRELEGVPGVTAFRAASLNEAAARGATRILSARLERAGLRAVAHWTLEETRGHKTEAWGQVEAAPDWIAASRRLAQGVVQRYRPQSHAAEPEVHNTRAAERWTGALACRNAADAVPDFEAAVAADPACGWCWIGLAEAASASGDRPKALAALAASREKGKGMGALPRARLNLLEAVLRSDEAGRLAALEALAVALPEDLAVAAELGELYVKRKRYQEASASFRKALGYHASSGAVWNSYAYALAYEGKGADARQAVARYGQLDTGPNPADSEGEILLMAGEFSRAARAFHASYEKDKAFNQGAAAEKEALAYWLAGEKKKAAEAVDAYLGPEANGRNALAGIVRARWEMLFGRTAASEANLESISRNDRHPAAPVASVLVALRALWREDPKKASEAADRAMRQSRIPAQRALAELAQAAVDPASAGRIGTPQMRLEALALAAILRGEWPKAAEAWKKAMDGAPGGNDQLHREMLAFSLVMSGRAREAEPLVAGWWPLLAPEQMLVYDFLTYPYACYTRGAAAAAAGRSADAQRYFDQFAQFAGDRADRFGLIRRAREATRL